MSLTKAIKNIIRQRMREKEESEKNTNTEKPKTQEESIFRGDKLFLIGCN